MKIRLIIFTLMLSNPIILVQAAQPTAIKTKDHPNLSQEVLIVDMLNYLNQFWADKGQSLSRKNIAQYFDPNTTLIINGKTVYTGYDQLEAHFKKVSQSTREKTRFPLLEIISVGNQVIVHSNVDVHDKNGNYFPANAIAIFTFHHNRIIKWDEVVNSKYLRQTESEKVVYSN